MVVRNADGSECAPREVDLASDQVMRRRVGAVLDPFTEDLTPHAVLFDQLGDERFEDEQGAAVDASAWTEAIWAGKSIEDLLREGTDDETLAPPGGVVGIGEADRPRDEAVPESAVDTKEVFPPVDGAAVGEEPVSTDVSDGSEPEPWEAAEAEESGGGADAPAEPDHEPEPWEAAEAAESGGIAEAEPDHEPEPWEAAEAAEATTGAEAPDPATMSEGEIAARKKAHQKAISAAYSQGGEAAVQEVASKHWSEFPPDTSDGS